MPSYFHPSLEEDIAPKSFTLQGEDYDVPCVFQVWVERDYPRPLPPRCSLPSGFAWTKDPSMADFAIRRVGVYAGRAFVDAVDKSTESHYFMTTDLDPTRVVDYLNAVTWVTGNTTGPRSISKDEVSKALLLLTQG